MTITELREISTGKFLLGFSDGSELRVGLNTVADLSLFRGRELTEQDYEDILSAAGLAACKERALRIIGARPKSCKELYDRLTEKGETPENAEQTVLWLLELRYLDDLQYGQMLLRHYAARGYGAGKIKNELFRHGVPKSLWDEIFEQLPETEDKVYSLLCKRLGEELPDRAELKKATDALFRRGFSWDEIKTAVSRFKQEHPEE